MAARRRPTRTPDVPEPDILCKVAETGNARREPASPATGAEQMTDALWA